MTASKPESVFVLRNNDLGDVLLVTPLLHALRRVFPEARLLLGVGDWAASFLDGNPDIDEVLPMNAPWHNKRNCRFPANSPRTFLEGLFFVLFSREARNLARKRITHGIDVLGSRQGSWLLRRARIPHRHGVRGYAGGDNWCESCVPFREDRSVAEAALAFLSLLGVGSPPEVEPRPRILLSEKEKTEAEDRWGSRPAPDSLRIILAPGAGFPEKRWGDDNFSRLASLLLERTSHRLAVLGGAEDAERITTTESPETSERLANHCGSLSLRQSAALVAKADFVVTNTTVTMHFAGAFRIPSLTLLGPWYDSAKLHARQWGYPEGQVLGPEKADGRASPLSPEEALDAFVKQTNLLPALAS